MKRVHLAMMHPKYHQASFDSFEPVWLSECTKSPVFLRMSGNGINMTMGHDLDKLRMILSLGKACATLGIRMRGA